MTGSPKHMVDNFTQRVQQALEHIVEPGWLGKHSPLATPYFLGERLTAREDADTEVGRGKVLQEVLREMLTRMAEANDAGRYAQQVLDLRYFQRKSEYDILEELSVSRPSYFRHRSDAMELLATTLLHWLKPALRLETPVLPSSIVGRQDIIARCVPSLRDGCTVALTGAGGIGKTTLGLTLAEQFPSQPVFWYTFYPGLNDSVSNLVFALGFFLHHCGSGSLWRQLVADAGAVKLELAPGLIRYDLSCLSAPVLLCFDEVDLLRPGDVEAHAQLVVLLESLRGTTPMLMIGQRVGLETDVAYSLHGLAVAEGEALLEQASIQLQPDDSARLGNYTQGNPRLLKLFATLYKTGDSLEDALQQLSDAPSLESLLRRVKNRLITVEQEVLNALAVFRRPVSPDLLPLILDPEIRITLETILASLVARELVQYDRLGGVALLPAYRPVLYNLLSREDRESRHLQAATVRSTGAEYTAAAYHYAQAGQPRAAVWLWYMHRTDEINQGQGRAALHLLYSISANDLGEDDRTVLLLARREMELLSGEHMTGEQSSTHAPGEALTDLPDDVFTAIDKRMQGHQAEQHGDLEDAIIAYRAGLETVERLSGEAASFHKNLAWVMMRQTELDAAWHEAQLARYEAENLQGYVQEEMGHYVAAERFFLSALALAEHLGHTQGEAKTLNNLTRLLTHRRQFTAAHDYAERASQLFEHIGKIDSLASVKINQALNYNLEEQPRAAIPYATEALALFERLDQAWGRAAAAQNLAEAYLALGELDEAEQFAAQVVQEKERKTLPDGLRVLGEVKLARGELQAAEDLIEQSIKRARDNTDQFLEAYGWRSLALVYLAQQRRSDALAGFEQAIALFQKLDVPQEVERTAKLRSRANDEASN